MISLDDLDLRILSILQAEGRLSNVELAQRVGLSPSPCLRRVRALEEAGVLSAYGAVIDQKKLGLDITAYIQVNLERHSDELVAQFESAVLREPEVVACYVMSGAFDFLLKVVTRDLEAYADFAMRRLLKVPGVKDIASSFVLEVVKAPGRLPLERARRFS